MKRKPPLPPLVTLITLRPNGVELAREGHAFTTPGAIVHRARELRLAVRTTRGWTPAFRVIVTHRDVTPFVDRDETQLWLGSEANT